MTVNKGKRFTLDFYLFIKEIELELKLCYNQAPHLIVQYNIKILFFLLTCRKFLDKICF